MNKDIIEAKMFGLVFGNASGWDQVDDTVIHYYDFKPNDWFKIYVPDQLTDYDIQFNYLDGKIDLVKGPTNYPLNLKLELVCEAAKIDSHD